MAKAYASIIIKAPVEAVWSGRPQLQWSALDGHLPLPNRRSKAGFDADVVGCIRSFHTHDGGHIRERLLALDDANYCFTYNFEKPAFPVKNYIATLQPLPRNERRPDICRMDRDL